jgi:tRNA U38,U39,U40 pseudouridine synthase TruA
MVLVGSGKIAQDEVKKMLEGRDRTKSGPNAPSCGLYFMGATY